MIKTATTNQNSPLIEAILSRDLNLLTKILEKQNNEDKNKK